MLHNPKYYTTDFRFCQFSRILPCKKGFVKTKTSACRLYRHAEQMTKNAGIFREIVFVGVRWYGREQFRGKQATARKTRCFSCGFLSIYADSRGHLFLQISSLTFYACGRTVFFGSLKALQKQSLLVFPDRYSLPVIIVTQISGFNILIIGHIFFVDYMNSSLFAIF